MTEKEKQELQRLVRDVWNRMPQTDPITRLSAVIQLVVEASDLKENESLQGVVRYVRLITNAPAATIVTREDDNPWRELADIIASQEEAANLERKKDKPT